MQKPVPVALSTRIGESTLHPGCLISNCLSATRGIRLDGNSSSAYVQDGKLMGTLLMKKSQQFSVESSRPAALTSLRTALQKLSLSSCALLIAQHVLPQD